MKVLKGFFRTLAICTFAGLALLGSLAIAVFLLAEPAERLHIAAIVLKRDGSRQAPWFDEVRFGQIHEGMPLNRVFELIGPPLRGDVRCNEKIVPFALTRKDCSIKMPDPCADSEVNLMYADQGEGSSDYKIRHLTIRGGLVSRILKEFALD